MTDSERIAKLEHDINNLRMVCDALSEKVFNKEETATPGEKPDLMEAAYDKFISYEYVSHLKLSWPPEMLDAFSNAVEYYLAHLPRSEGEVEGRINGIDRKWGDISIHLTPHDIKDYKFDQSVLIRKKG